PHASTTPRATLRKLACDAVVMGEAEEILPVIAAAGDDWREVPSLAREVDGRFQANGALHASDMATLPALTWPADALSRHRHHHHRFDRQPAAPGAEMETSRGCPYHCTFCAKDNFRNAYRRRPLPVLVAELERFIAQGVEYVYFIDEIFLPNRELLQWLAGRGLKIGVQTRIDLWSHD